jgi:hypothetical protein
MESQLQILQDDLWSFSSTSVEYCFIVLGKDTLLSKQAIWLVVTTIIDIIEEMSAGALKLAVCFLSVRNMHGTGTLC